MRLRGTVGQVNDLGADPRLRRFGKLGGGEITAEDARTKPNKGLGNAAAETVSGAADRDRLAVEADLHHGASPGARRQEGARARTGSSSDQSPSSSG
jgi:hypothetical protein